MDFQSVKINPFSWKIHTTLQQRKSREMKYETKTPWDLFTHIFFPFRLNLVSEIFNGHVNNSTYLSNSQKHLLYIHKLSRIEYLNTPLKIVDKMRNIRVTQNVAFLIWQIS